MFKPPYLQPYKGKATRHTCPACGAKESFTLYINGETNEHINSKVGKCNRESKCGYHYTPKQYFIDNPTSCNDVAGNFSTPPLWGGRVGSKPTEPPYPIGIIPFSYVERSASYQSNFVRFLCEFLTTEQISSIGDKYAIGATKNKEIIYWQIDSKGKVRTGKIMQYDPLTGKRIKHESGAIDWVHNKLKKSNTLPEDYILQQCFFGEHLLGLHPEATLCIVESEKSALIAAAIFPEQVWLATGGIGNLSFEKCQVLKGRTVILFPDLNAFDKWSDKAKEIQKQCNCTISVSNILETNATPFAKAQGLDIADFIINQLKNKLDVKITDTKQVQSSYTRELQSMIEVNPIILKLINTLELIEE